MSDSLNTQQQNGRPQSSGKRMRSKQPSDCQRRAGNYEVESEKDSKPKGKVADLKSKVNCYKFTFIKLYLHVVFQGWVVAEVIDWREQCQNLLEILIQSKDSVPFRSPVNIERVPDYLDTMAIPKDLKTVGGKLEANNYATPSEFAKDVRLFFENFKKCKSIRKLKKTIGLSILFEDQFHKILDSYKRRKAVVKSIFKMDKSSSVGLKFYCFLRFHGGEIKEGQIACTDKLQNVSVHSFKSWSPSPTSPRR